MNQNPARSDRFIAVTLVVMVPEEARTVRAQPIVMGRYLTDSDSAATIITRTLPDAFSMKVGDTIPLTGGGAIVQDVRWLQSLV